MVIGNKVLTRMTSDTRPCSFFKVIGRSRSEIPDCVTTSDCGRGSGSSVDLNSELWLMMVQMRTMVLLLFFSCSTLAMAPLARQLVYLSQDSMISDLPHLLVLETLVGIPIQGEVGVPLHYLHESIPYLMSRKEYLHEKLHPL